MDSFERIKQVRLLQRSSLTVFHDPAISAREICASIAQTLDEGVIVAELRSDHINTAEGAFVRDSLLQGKVLLVIAAQRQKLPAQLLRAWNDFHDRPQSTSSNAGQFIRFDRTRTSPAPGLGMLGIIVPGNYQGERLEPRMRVYLSGEDMPPNASPHAEVRMLGRNAVSMSMKLLCLLHQRDDVTARHHGSVEDIMSGDRPITWTDLQCLLQTQADSNMFAILEGFAARGRIESEQLDFAAEAIAFLRRDNEKDERIGASGLEPSIYHALWVWAFLEQEGCVFRGQRDSRWRQDSSLMRAERNGTSPTLATIVERLQRTQTFLDKLAADEQRLVGCSLDEGERLAIAQHYEMPTPLLDYTRSLAVAAFFATGAGDSSSLREGDVGVIYFIRPDDPVAATPATTASGLDFASAAGLRIGRLTIIEPKLPNKENRIARQKALFVEGFDSRDLQRMASGALYFRQQPGETFEDISRETTRGYLLAPDAELKRLADGVVPTPPRYSARLAGSTMPGDDMFGALGLHLRANLYKAQKFLDRAAVQAERLQPGLWPQLRAIIERHLNEARIAARTAEFAAPTKLVAKPSYGGIHYMLDDVDLALGELAEVAGLQHDALRTLVPHRPLNDFEKRPSFDQTPSPPSETPGARIVLAIGLFLVGLEFLRTVRGEVAEQYIQNAGSALVPLEREG